MADPKPDPKEGASFFRKVVRFVANPATDWAELNAAPEENAQSGYAKSELKAMIERKRRNDFVRKREFDMLRKIRREGLPAEGLVGLAGTSNLDDSDQPRASNLVQSEVAVKAKIDEIEQQMEGESLARRSAPSRPASFYNSATVPGALDARAAPMNQPFDDTVQPAAAPVAGDGPSTRVPLDWAPTPATSMIAPPPAGRPVVQNAGVHIGHSDFNNPFAVEVSEIAHDPDLDEAVISFANADFEGSERAITSLISDGGPRQMHAETWLVLFDLYRATGQQQPFESLAMDYAQRFGFSAPQWFSIPQLVAAEAPPPPSPARIEGSIGWVAPQALDVDAVTQLRAKTLQMPLPWTLDWGPLQAVDPDACNALIQLLRTWAPQRLEMRWVGVERLLGVLGDLAPTNVRDADPIYWLLRLEVLRLANRPDQFDEIAIDYCVTYEVSPPSWEPVACKVKLSDGAGATLNSRSMVTDVSTGFVESQLVEESGGVRSAGVELSGQLVGDIGPVLKRLELQLGSASLVSINCSRLIRMDFIAAGDLLNWVLLRRGENRGVHFDDAHRLLALFFNAMGINEHARVKVRNI